ncbi:hypothetical protein [Amycolatopsis pigmentata]|uniref:Zinc-binding dehydrogenase n=1 Tax=Amycolatopsis pigmentata TaxID=450801 RepID=A0ABW5FXI2_9PSEU
MVVERTFPFDETAGAVAHVLAHHASGKIAIAV